MNTNMCIQEHAAGAWIMKFISNWSNVRTCNNRGSDYFILIRECTGMAFLLNSHGDIIIITIDVERGTQSKRHIYGVSSVLYEICLQTTFIKQS